MTMTEEDVQEVSALSSSIERNAQTILDLIDHPDHVGRPDESDRLTMTREVAFLIRVMAHSSEYLAGALRQYADKAR